MNWQTFVYIGIAIFGIIVLVILIVFYIKNSKSRKKKQFIESSYWTIDKFHKNFRNTIDTKRIKVAKDKDYAYKLSKHCGFLVASCKSSIFPITTKKYFKPNKYGKENHIRADLSRCPHVMVFGSTGSGKSDTLLVPNILLNSLTKERPSGVVFDPKGEIYEKTAPFLRIQGYKVININLNNPTNSFRWNFYQFAIDDAIEYVKLNLLNNFLIDHNGIAIKPNYMQLNKSKIDAKYAEAIDSIIKTSSIMIEMMSKEKSIWTKSGSSILSTAGTATMNYLISLAFENASEYLKNQDLKHLNDIQNVENYFLNDLKLNEIINQQIEKLCIRNVSNIIDTTLQEDWVKFVYSQQLSGVQGTFAAAPETYQSYITNIAAAIGYLSNDDLKNFINKTDFSYADLINQHTIIFINIPASAEERKQIATLLTQQIFNYLDSKSKGFPYGKLPIPFYFYFEELANIPKIPCYETILTLGRGMNINSLTVIQSLAQLNKTYGVGTEKIVWSNTIAKVYLYASDSETRKYISDQYGEVEKIKENGQRIIRKLIEPEELGLNQPGRCLVMMNREKPIWLNLASFSDYKFFNEWDRTALLNQKSKFKLNDIHNKKLNKQNELAVASAKAELNMIITPDEDFELLENFIEKYNQELDEQVINETYKRFYNNVVFNDIELLTETIKQIISENKQNEYSYDLFSELLNTKLSNHYIDIINANQNGNDNKEEQMQFNKLVSELNKILIQLKKEKPNIPYLEHPSDSSKLQTLEAFLFTKIISNFDNETILENIFCLTKELINKNNIISNLVQKNNIIFIEKQNQDNIPKDIKQNDTNKINTNNILEETNVNKNSEHRISNYVINLFKSYENLMIKKQIIDYLIFNGNLITNKLTMSNQESIKQLKDQINQLKTNNQQLFLENREIFKQKNYNQIKRETTELNQKIKAKGYEVKELRSLINDDNFRNEINIEVGQLLLEISSLILN